MLQRIYEAIGFVFLAIVLALSARPSIAPATPVPPAPTNITPPNPAGNEAALRAEIERLELANSELNKQVENFKSTTVAPVWPAPVPVVMEMAAGTGCEGGSCAVPRARLQAEKGEQPVRIDRQRARRFGGADGRVMTPFR